MEDRDIVQLYFDRNERAISETDKKYGAYCHSIAVSILKSAEDCEECVSDTWMKAWETIPPQRPVYLSSYLGRITRNLSINKYRKAHTSKRGGNNADTITTELKECIPDSQSVDSHLEEKELALSIDRFLASLPTRERKIFVRRYFFMEEKQGYRQAIRNPRRYGLRDPCKVPREAPRSSRKGGNRDLMKKLNEDRLLDAIGSIDEKYIRESERRSVFAPIIKYGSAVAACLAFALLTGVAMYSASKRDDGPADVPITYTSATESTNEDSSQSEDITFESDSDTVTNTSSDVNTTDVVTETETEAESESQTETETETETESESLPPPVYTDVTEYEPVEPTIPTEDPEETEEPSTEGPISSDTDDPVAPSDPIESTEPSTEQIGTDRPPTTGDGTFVIITDEASAAVTENIGTTQIITGIITEQVTATESPSYSTTIDAPTSPITTPSTERPVPPANEYEKYYTGEAPTNGSSSGVRAHYISQIPGNWCDADKTANTEPDTVFANSTDIFAGDISSVFSVEVILNGNRYYYLSVVEITLSKDIYKYSDELTPGTTVRVLLPHGVNTTLGHYTADDIVSVLGDPEIQEMGYGVFCVKKITEDDKLEHGSAYYPLSNIADYVLPDGMNYLLLSNAYYTFYNEKTYTELYEKHGSLVSAHAVFEYFAAAKAEGRLD